MIRWAVVVLVCIFPSVALSAVYQCEVNGRKKFQELPCEQGQQKKLDQFSNETVGPIHESWFATPRYLGDTVQCENRVCTCGSVYKDFSFTNDVSLLADAISDLRSSWHKYSGKVRKFSYNQKYYNEYNTGPAEESACAVAINQYLVKRFYPTVYPILQVANEAEMDLIHTQYQNTVCKKPYNVDAIDAATPAERELIKTWIACERRRASLGSVEVHGKKMPKGYRSSTYRRIKEDLYRLKMPRQK